MINTYPEDPDYAKQLKIDLKRGIPDIKIHEITTPYDGSEIYDEKFGSACGLYTNMLVTPERIYFPQFGIKQDALALQQIRRLTKTNCHSNSLCTGVPYGRWSTLYVMAIKGQKC